MAFGEDRATWEKRLPCCCYPGGLRPKTPRGNLSQFTSTSNLKTQQWHVSVTGLYYSNHHLLTSAAYRPTRQRFLPWFVSLFLYPSFHPVELQIHKEKERERGYDGENDVTIRNLVSTTNRPSPLPNAKNKMILKVHGR